MKNNMILATVLLVSTIFMSCDNDDDSQPSIVGTWVEISYEEEEFINNVSQGIVNSSSQVEQPVMYTFTNDGTFDFSYDSSSETITNSGTYSIDGDTLTLTYESEDLENEEYVYAFTLMNNQLVLAITEEYTRNDNAITSIVTTTFNMK